MGRQQILILLIAIVSALLGTAFLSGKFSDGPKLINNVAIAQVDIGAHTFISSEQLMAGSVDPALYPSDSLMSPDQVMGHIPREAIRQGEPITKAKVFTGTAGLEYVIPQGFRAMSIPVSQPEQELKLFLPGSRIDVIATVQERNGYFRTGTILEDVLLLMKEAMDVPGRGKQISFIIAVDPKGAEKMALAVGHGEVRVVLRQEADDSVLDSTGVSISDLIKGMGADDQSIKAYEESFEPGSMEVLRGTRKTTEYFDENTLNKARSRLVGNER